ncbi:hypothetical protein PO909_016889 [Leuciscus waleckii]
MFPLREYDGLCVEVKTETAWIAPPHSLPLTEDPRLPPQACEFSSVLTDRAYKACRQAVSSLHALALLQVIFECIRPRDWFAAIDLKDVYFHVSILPRHRPSLRFAFEGQAYQYKVLHFRLAVLSCFFTKLAHGLLHMRPLQHWLHDQDASNTGWGATYNGHAVVRIWTGPRVHLALRRLKMLLLGKHVLVRADNSVGWEIRGKARPDRQVPEGSEETESRPSIPSWDLSLVLTAQQRPPFEPLQAAELKVLSLKTVLLLALASIKRVGDLHAFSVDESCLEFGPATSHVILSPQPGYVPKVPTTPFGDQVVNLQALPPEEADPALAFLCPVRSLRLYVDRTQTLRTSDQLFVYYGGQQKGKAVSQQRLAHWIVDAIILA